MHIIKGEKERCQVTKQKYSDETREETAKVVKENNGEMIFSFNNKKLILLNNHLNYKSMYKIFISYINLYSPSIGIPIRCDGVVNLFDSTFLMIFMLY
jgi:hypothetical protein